MGSAMKRAVPLLTVLAFLLAACAGPGLAPERAAGIKSVALVSGLGDEITLRYIGSAVVLGDEERRTAVDWPLNESVLAALSRSLSPRYEIRSLQYDKFSFNDRTTLAERTVGSSERLTRYLRGLAPPGFVDAYVVVTETAWGGDPITHSGLPVAGLGLYARRDVLGGLAVATYTAYDIHVVDGRSFEELASAPASIPASKGAWSSWAYAYSTVDPSWWHASFAEMPDDEKRALRESLIALIDTSVPFTLERLALVGAREAQ